MGFAPLKHHSSLFPMHFHPHTLADSRQSPYLYSLASGYCRQAAAAPLLLALALLIGCKANTPPTNYRTEASAQAASATTTSAMNNTADNHADHSHSAEERAHLQQKLSATQFAVVCNEGTEPPFANAYWDNKEPGIYVDIVSGKPLFSSIDKFDSTSGWPSFTRPLQAEEIIERTDNSHGMVRTEVRSRSGKAHLGHVFPDGLAPTGLRYCINSASLRFIPVNDLEKEGYGEYLKLFTAQD